MGLPEDDRRALQARLAPSGAGAAEVVASAVAEDEELREIVVDVHGDVVAFTDRRALFVADGANRVVEVGYDEVEVRKRDAGLAIDALIEGGRLILDVARGTFVRLAIVGSGAPPGRATWLPVRQPPARPMPEPPPASEADPHTAQPLSPPAPPGGATYTGEPHSIPRPPPPIPRRAPSVRPPASGAAATPMPAPARPATEPSAPARPPRQTPIRPDTGAAPPAPAMPAAPPAAPVPTTQPPGLPPAGWHPDPSGRHWWRWWDGLGWTDHVADGSGPFLDPLPPRS